MGSFDLMTMTWSFAVQLSYELIGSVVEWLKHRVRDQHGLDSNPLALFCCVLGKDTLRHISLLGGPSKQF